MECCLSIKSHPLVFLWYGWNMEEEWHSGRIAPWILNIRRLNKLGQETGWDEQPKPPSSQPAFWSPWALWIWQRTLRKQACTADRPVAFIHALMHWVRATLYKTLEGPPNLGSEDLRSSFHYATENNNSSALLISPDWCKAQKYFANWTTARLRYY